MVYTTRVSLRGETCVYTHQGVPKGENCVYTHQGVHKVCTTVYTSLLLVSCVYNGVYLPPASLPEV